MESVIQIKQPMVRDFSTGGGHGPGDTIVEGDSKIVTKKWQGYAPQNLNVVGKPMPPLPEVAIPRFLGKAEYATRVVLPNMLHVKILTSPHPRARIQRIDTSRAEKMPGVARILTYRDFEDQKPIFGMMGVRSTFSPANSDFSARSLPLSRQIQRIWRKTLWRRSTFNMKSFLPFPRLNMSCRPERRISGQAKET